MSTAKAEAQEAVENGDFHRVLQIGSHPIPSASQARAAAKRHAEEHAREAIPRRF